MRKGSLKIVRRSLFYYKNGFVAQSGEHPPCKREVKSSNLFGSIGFFVQKFQMQIRHRKIYT